VLGGLDKTWERKGLGDNCVDKRLSYWDWIKCGKRRERGNCVLRADFLRRIV